MAISGDILEHPARTPIAQITRAAVALFVVLGSGGVGYLGSHIWPLAEFSASEAHVASAVQPKSFEPVVLLPVVVAGPTLAHNAAPSDAQGAPQTAPASVQLAHAGTDTAAPVVSIITGLAQQAADGYSNPSPAERVSGKVERTSVDEERTPVQPSKRVEAKRALRSARTHRVACSRSQVCPVIAPTEYSANPVRF